MRRAVVTFPPTPTGRPLQFSLTEPLDSVFPEVSEFPMDGNQYILDDGPHSLHAIVQEVGSQLASALVRNTRVRLQLELTKQGDQKSYYFEINADDDALDKRPWESLCYENNFLALSRQSPIGRMCGLRDQKKEPERYITLKPLRVLAILGVPATAKAELATLREIFSSDTLQDPNLPIELCILTSDEETLTNIQLNPSPNISAERIDDKWSVTTCIKRFRPKLIHINADVMEGQSPSIRLLRMDEKNQTQEVLLEVSEIMNFGDIFQIVLLLTLNCTGETGEMKPSNNLARWLVRNGFPAAVGMRGCAEPTIVRTFYSGFYEDTLQMIADIPAGGEGQEIDWADLLVMGRNKIRHAPSESCMHWTLPVIYCRPSSVRMTRFQASDTDSNLKIAAQVREIARICEDISASDMPGKSRLLDLAATQIDELSRQFEP